MYLYSLVDFVAISLLGFVMEYSDRFKDKDDTGTPAEKIPKVILFLNMR
ncbi:MAG: hypothetical protein K2G02_05610 [Phocaeicola sp.]|nr:hypothetical protein [Phocaeicola sp.]